MNRYISYSSNVVVAHEKGRKIIRLLVPCHWTFPMQYFELQGLPSIACLQPSPYFCGLRPFLDGLSVISDCFPVLDLYLFWIVSYWAIISFSRPSVLDCLLIVDRLFIFIRFSVLNSLSFIGWLSSSGCLLWSNLDVFSHFLFSLFLFIFDILVIFCKF